MNSAPEILLVEDNATLGYALSEYLKMQGMQVTLCSDGEAGERMFRQQVFDLCIIDVMLPKQDGFSLAKKIRDAAPSMPFLFLTARAMKVDKLRGFQLGADDYIVKPVDEEELVARIRAVLRRGQESHQTLMPEQLGAFRIDWDRRLLSSHDREVQLTEKEVSLLRMLIENKNQLLSRDAALRQLWGGNDYFNRRSMDVHIARLRKYLKDDSTLNIVNVHGRGFVLEENVR